MRVFIAGGDGYLGWSLVQYLGARGHQVGAADLFLRRRWVEEMGSWSALPIASMRERLQAFKERFGEELRFWEGDLRDYGFVEALVQEFQPDAIVHLGECPSAPYSMMDVHHAVFVQTNNITTTFNLLFAMRDHRPQAHLVKLGTMGEYGTPRMDIPEGFFEVEFRGRRERLPFPRQAGSWYHWSKVHGSNNIMLACKIWKLRATDVMQGVVFGTGIDEREEDERFLTRLDFDQSFGTAVNRYCCQAVIGHPLTPFGQGRQRRGFLPLRDSMQCLTLAIENPPAGSEYRVFNQFQEVYDVTEMARKVQKAGADLGLKVEVRNLENPRLEAEEHYYNPDHQHLVDLGYKPAHDVETEMRLMIQDLMKYRARIEAKREVLIPDVRWDGRREKVRFLELVKTGNAPAG
ncbi:NAD-dependent epimerase/dehydratase family protein [Acidobacteriia bacterium AH_259_A11_L15]|nr:NAD-dependent epimerase/dehydratase family protein [Acidobacteriia bacterium AH_259_A11_L15]